MKAINLICLALCVVLATADTEFGFAEDGSLIGPRVVGGQKAEKGQFPYQVSLRTRLTREHFCGASIISSRFLLSAAHCVEGLHSQPAFIVAVVGAVRRQFDGMTVNLNKITKHSGWDRSKLINDISLLRTAGEIIFSESVQPIALPKQNIDKNTPVVLSGWGKTTTNAIFLPFTLQYAEIQALSYNDCLDRLRGSPYSETMICTTSKPGVGACFGDSGGPLVDVSDPANKALVGLASWVYPCALGRPDVFTRIYSYLDWIQENVAKQSSDLE